MDDFVFSRAQLTLDPLAEAHGKPEEHDAMPPRRTG